MRRMMALLLAVLLPLVAVAEEPELNEQGFLADSVTDEEYVLVDVEHGQWVYLSHTLSIRLTRYDEEEGPRRYYVADVRCSPESSLQAYATEGRRVGYTLKNPRAMAVEQEAVLALSDDFSGYRMHNDKRVGIVIRNGNVLSDKTYKSTNRRGWPNLDTLAVYDDGCMEPIPVMPTQRRSTWRLEPCRCTPLGRSCCRAVNTPTMCWTKPTTPTMSRAWPLAWWSLITTLCWRWKAGRMSPLAPSYPGWQKSSRPWAFRRP